MARILACAVMWIAIGCSESKIVPLDPSPAPGNDTQESPAPVEDSGRVPDSPSDTGSPCDDSDGDGICDSEDACEGHDDSVDTDEDGVADGCDPCPEDALDDSDGDGVCDSEDRCAGHDDGLDADTDGNPDGCDPCPLDALDDSDGDDVCDSDDLCEGYTDHLDLDFDGVPDGCDVCPMDNPDDTDGDGVCTSFDACEGHDDSLDADGDGVADGCDVCADADDAVDTDEDGVADGCDLCPLDALDDSDLDGVCDSADACPGSDDGEDGDGDGVADGCDSCPLDALDDSDGDGLCDSDDACPGFDDALDGDDDGVADGCDPCPDDNPDDADGDGICDSDPQPLPRGLIVAYTGEGVPDGWRVCNGEDGTPDLRERFVLGSLTDELDAPAGGASHAHDGFTDFTTMSTGHASPPGRSCSPPGAWCTQKASNTGHSHDMSHDHTVDGDATLPPYVDVIYLMNESASMLPTEAVLARIDGWEDGGVSESMWTIRTDLEDRFLRGAAEGDSPGGEGGSNEHDHGGVAGLETTTGIFYGSHGMTVTCYGASTTDVNHSHRYEHDHTFSVEPHMPPYVRALWVSPVEESPAPMIRAVAMWFGDTHEIPTGWVVADGSGGGPDLSGVYVLGTATPSAMGEEGGDTEHAHAMEDDPGGSTESSGGGNGHCTSGGGLMGFHSHSVPSHDHDMMTAFNEPPHQTLHYIMYVGDSD